MKSIDSNTAYLLQNSAALGLIESDFIVWEVKNLSNGNPVFFGFCSDHDSILASVVSPFTGETNAYNFVGGGAILSIGETKRTSNLSIRKKSVVMSSLHPDVRFMWTNHDMRSARVAIYQALFDPETRNIASMLLEFPGELNKAPKEIAAAGREGGIKFDIDSDTRQLTLVNYSKRSDAHQRTRDNDAFHRYIGVAGDWKIPWGQDSEGGR